MSALDLVLRWPVGTVSAGWVTAGGRQSPDRAEYDRFRPFPLASVTKPLFALAVLVAVEEGTLHLDQPAGPPGSTVRHLLAHASGLGPDGEVLAPPGERRIYSNRGFDILGDLLSESSGMDHRHYFHEAVVEPLGLGATCLEGSPAHGATSCVSDLLVVATELFSPRIISTATRDEATTPQLGELDGVLPGFGRQSPNPWGLGFEIRGHKQPHWSGRGNSAATYGHFGQAGTLFWVDPEAGVAGAALTDRPFGSWAATAWPPFCDAVLNDATIA